MWISSLKYGHDLNAGCEDDLDAAIAVALEEAKRLKRERRVGWYVGGLDLAQPRIFDDPPALCWETCFLEQG